MAITLGTVIPRWLRKISTAIALRARTQSRSGKSGTAQGKPRITVLQAAKRAVFIVTNFHAGRPPFDDTIKVPIGGFPPPPGQRFWVFIKPEGRVVRRTRSYSRFSGQTIKKKGFMTEAVEEVLVGPKGKLNLQKLANAIAVRMAREIASEMVKDMNANGIPASFTSSTSIRGRIV